MDSLLDPRLDPDACILWIERSEVVATITALQADYNIDGDLVSLMIRVNDHVVKGLLPRASFEQMNRAQIDRVLYDMVFATTR